jgi:hypothetical protein
MDAYMWNLELVWQLSFSDGETDAFDFFSERYFAYYDFLLGKRPFPDF